MQDLFHYVDDTIFMIHNPCGKHRWETDNFITLTHVG